MSSETFSRYLCLKLDRIPDVINAEAVSVEQAIFLATHSPMTNIAVERSPEAIDRATEEELLASLRAAAAADRHALMVVKGVQGTGKSHLVRWLRDRYETEQRLVAATGPRDVVLLIERASASLCGTLEQLLASGVFDDATSEEQVRRLRNAAVALEDAQLDHLLVNNLQVGAVGETMPDGSAVPRRVHRHAQDFLLNVVVRRQLMLPGGPVDRIRRFLNEGRGGGIGLEDAPEFLPADLDFPMTIRREITQEGNRNADDLTKDLSQSGAIREQMARFLNALLPTAIQRTTALSGEDLKTIFFDLRRRLRGEGRGLVLFIEDVTSFTGIDAALMDVLVTQHTGEGNLVLCRMTSVVGVTDAFFVDRIPDNIKDRVTHQVALTAGGRSATQLADPRSVAELVGRYLNALRLEPEEIERWERGGASPAELPVFCDRCRFRGTCHPAFGAVSHLPGEASSPIGLYPFNETALWTMFGSLDEARGARTPRALLRSVVQYVLQSHADKIVDGSFPPPATRLGGEFAPPPLANSLQGRTITQQAGPRAASVETLVRVWGDRTVHATTDGEQRLVGGLSPAVFTAFALPLIEGEGDVQPDASPPTVGTGITATTDVQPDVQPVVDPLPTPTPTPRVVTQAEREAERIASWREGQPLQGYLEFAGRIADLFRETIDWDGYGVPHDLVNERLTPGRVFFEGQAGGEGSRVDRLPFGRTDEVVYALQALSALRTAPEESDPAKVGGAVSTLAVWRLREEARVLRFVRQPTGETPEPIPLVRIAIRTGVALAALRGGVAPAALGALERLLPLLIENRVPGRSSLPTPTEWRQELQAIKRRSPTAWQEVTDRLWQRVEPAALHKTLRASLNLARGGPRSPEQSGVFLDAATALDELEAFQADGWQLTGFDAKTDGWTVTWAQLADAWRILARFVPSGNAEAAGRLLEERGRLDRVMGTSDEETVVGAIGETLQTMSRYQKPNQVAGAGRLEIKQIAEARRRLRAVCSAAGRGDVVLSATLAVSKPTIDEVSATVAELTTFADFVSNELDAVEAELARIGVDDASERTEAELTGTAYRRILGAFPSAAPALTGEGRS